MTKVFGNLINKFSFRKFRFIRNIARIAFQHYREAKWEIFLYRFDKEAITLRAQWIRDETGWMILNQGNLELEHLIIELFRRLKEDRILACIKRGENINFIRNLAALLKNGFPLNIPQIKEAIEGGSN